MLEENDGIIIVLFISRPYYAKNTESYKNQWIKIQTFVFEVFIDFTGDLEKYMKPRK